MRVRLDLASPLLLCAGLAGCGSSANHPPADATGDAGPPATIQVTTSDPPVLVAFRDGPTAAWQTVAAKTPTTFELAVHGAYLVAVVFDVGRPGKPAADVEYFLQTPDDNHLISLPGNPAGSVMVTGHMVQAGSVAFGDDRQTSTTAAWDYQLAVTPGAHDLLAFSADHVIARPAVDAAHDVALAELDTTKEGAALTDVTFTVANAGAGELITARAAVESPTTAFAPVQVFSSPTPLKVIPDGVLTASQVQSVSLSGQLGGHRRFLRRPFHVGGDTAYTLPVLIGTPSWTVSGDPTLSWPSVTASSSLSATLRVPATGAVLSATVSPSFIAATHAAQVVFDTQLPQFKPEWRIAFSAGYTRSLFAQRLTGAQVETETFDETIAASVVAPGPAAPVTPRGAGWAAP